MTLTYKKLQYINQIFMFEYQKASVALLESTFPRHAQHPYLCNKENVRWRCRNQYNFVSRIISHKVPSRKLIKYLYSICVFHDT